MLDKRIGKPLQHIVRIGAQFLFGQIQRRDNLVKNAAFHIGQHIGIVHAGFYGVKAL